MHQTRAATFVKAAVTLFVAGVAGPVLLSAAALNGNLSLSSHGTATVAVNGTVIDFEFSGTESSGFPPIVTSGAVTGNGDLGLFDITSASTGSFAPIAGSTVVVHDLDSTLEPTGSTSGLDLPLNNFITFTAMPGWNITLTEILPGTQGACTSTGTSCTPPGSPFNLTNEAGNQVLVGFSFLGTANDGLGNKSSVAGTFSTTFSNTTYQAILADLAAGDSIVSSDNATIGVTPISTAPEPASIYMLLLGSGLLMVSAAYRRRQRR
jgi:hypothetical protein